ncbi:MAG TPA: ATP-dependent DNA helicase [bacterium]|nr:ATP-dependent DNA helicase [bacterium]HPG47233.1 ATP-dependent DNA helicase [bacterium]HPM99705.1 ATP-dependent DNA helicase [bacterium]
MPRKKHSIFANTNKPIQLISLAPDSAARQCLVERFSPSTTETLAIKTNNDYPFPFDYIKHFLYNQLDTDQDTLFILYDSLMWNLPNDQTRIIDIKLIIEWLFPGLQDYGLESIRSSYCTINDDFSFRPLLRLIVETLVSDNPIDCITRACMPRISHKLAHFVLWLIEHAAEYGITEKRSIESGQPFFPDNPAQLNEILKQTFWGTRQDNRETESENTDSQARERTLISLNQIDSFFHDPKHFTHLPHYQPREGQIQYAKHIGTSLNEQNLLLIEAGTGTGKTLGYCLPALLYLTENPQEKIVLATSTKNLQTQIFSKDLPFLHRTKESFQSISASILKGKANYFCLQAMVHEFYRDFISQKGTAEDQLLWLYFFRLLAVPWCDLERVSVGLSLAFSSLPQFIKRINSADHCFPQSCSFSPCMHEFAVQKAEQAQLVVTNHHLLFYLDTYLSQPWQNAIVDESEQLPEAALSCFSSTIDSDKINDLCERFLKIGKRSLYHAFSHLLARQHSLAESELMPHSQSLYSSVIQIYQLNKSIVSALQKREGMETYLSAVSSSDNMIFKNLLELNSQTALAVQAAEAIKEKLPSPLPRAFLSQFLNWMDQLENTAANLDTCFQFQDSIYHCVIFSHEQNKIWCLEYKPLYTDYLTYKTLLENRGTLIFTSASLSLAKEGLSFIKDALGICHCKDIATEIRIPSPDTYYQNALGIIYRGIGYPQFIEDSQEYQEYLQKLMDTLKFLITEARGKTLVLFTNAQKLNYIYQQIEADIRKAGILPLIQNGSSLAEIELFKKRHESVLFGMNRFWRGVDFPGKTLQQVVIVQLPRSYHLSLFWKKRKELDAERMERYYRNISYFNFRQMVGRLIRSEKDSGLIVLLDSRPAAHAFILNTPIALDKWCYVDGEERLKIYISKTIH